MIVSHILGGLGNQMFQYAAGLALAREFDVSHRLDVSGFSEYALHHGFELERIFNCSIEIASRADIRNVLGWQCPLPIRQVLGHRRFSLIRRRNFVVEPHFQYWAGIRNSPRDCYLVGYWQSERYFKQVEPAIRQAFTFRYPLVGKNADYLAQVSCENTVSLHIRRGDYVNNAKTNAIHGLLPLSYYQKAIAHMTRSKEGSQFFVFSDDIEWARQNLKLDAPCMFIGHNHGAESYRDMQLMSHCHHHIIANSSFSWWGAWLNPDPDKIVIAPKKWFANANTVSDLFPPGWVELGLETPCTSR